MQLVLSEEQEDLRRSLRRFLADHSPTSRVREVMATEERFDREVWARLTGELGVAGLAVAESDGGAGYGQVERAVVLEELGRSLTPVPFLASAVLAADVLSLVDDEAARRELLPGIADGSTIATLAGAEAAADGRVAFWQASPTVRATPGDGGTWTLTGTKTLVLAGSSADLLVVTAATPDAGLAFFVVTAGAPGLSTTPLTPLDPTRTLADVAFEGTPARLLRCDDPAGVLSTVADRASVALAAEQLGAMQRVLEMIVEYAKVRVQFGRFIGSYQAVKHACADMLVDTELATSVVRHAAGTADHAPEELPLAAALARAYVPGVAFKAAADAVPLHGGIGYTWEYDAQLYYKRTKGMELLFGGTPQARVQLADRLGI